MNFQWQYDGNWEMPLTARMQKKRWVMKSDDRLSDALAAELKISPLMAQLLLNRGISGASAAAVFLRPRLTELISPDKMPGLNEAAKLVRQAILDKRKITIYGDYDVDGITSVAILWQLLTNLGANVDFYIPHRIEEGYGVNDSAIRTLAENGTTLIITVDCGITANDSAKLARQLGIELIITDHHQFSAHLPEAAVIVHPALDKTYPNQDSSGAMVAFKLAWAIAGLFSAGARLTEELREFMINATSLAAMGTVADVCDLRGENRVLTSFGMKSLSDCKLCGMQALIESAGLTGKGLDSYSIGFRLAPMLNAAGRMGHARLAVELLTSKSAVHSAQIAEYLKEQNNQRRKCEQRIFKQVCEMIVSRGLNHPDRRTIVLSGSDWHSGVIGIVASRVVDKFYRPAIMINADGAIAQGSARSVTGFDILAGISACSHHLESFGGHKMAAGITLRPEKIEAFTCDLETYAAQNLSHDVIEEKLYIDSVASLGHIKKDTIDQLELLAPFGPGNPQPVFASMAVRAAGAPRRVGSSGEHLQFAVSDNTGTARCIGFGMGKYEKKLLEVDFFNIAYEPRMNSYNGASNVQLDIQDIQFD